MSETIGEARARIRAQYLALHEQAGPVERWIIRRLLRKLDRDEARMARRRDAAIRAWWREMR